MARIVAIVGRPNVGKSTLFNRLIGQRKAIVDDVSGVTRDRHYGVCEWLDQEFTVIDTGGFVRDSDDIFEAAIREQVHIAMEEAALLLFMVDVSSGLTPLDSDFADELRKSKKPVILIANKVDNNERINDAAEFYALGFGEMHMISSMTGSGTGDLLDDVVAKLPAVSEEDREEDLPRIAIIGRPNVGKSSMVNALLGEERSIVTDIPGTTRDTINSRYKAFGMDFLLIDTAGIRKKGKVNENIEFYSVMRSITAIEECNVAVLMIDATLGIEAQDLSLFNLAERNGKGIVILINKWDLVEKDHKTLDQYIKGIKQKIAPFTDVPIIFTSTITKQRLFKAMETVKEVYERLTTKISTSKLNEVLLPIIEQTPPPSIKGKYIRIKYVTQLKTKVFSLAFFCNLPQYINTSYKRFLENKLRELFDLEGVPVRLFFRKK